MSSATPTTSDVAKWMADKIDEGGEIYQNEIAPEIYDDFGEQFTYYNDAGNLAINKKVLSEFGKLTKDTVVWSRRFKFWRKREPDDDPDKRMVD